MSAAGRGLALLLALLAAESLGAQPPAEGPVAVMPFKNLNEDASLEWLRLGIAETILSDLRASGRLQVVEREQVDRALGEIALQGARTTEESTAARVGRLVGARTVVLGSFQRAGKQLRLNARFVAVETGVVLGTAKETGPLERIFSLQDSLVARLLGTEARASPRPQRRSGPKLLRAYELYGRSLAAASQAERVGLLREAVEAEPDFPYAREELVRLEARLREYRESSAAALDARQSRLQELLSDEARSPQEREAAASQLLTQHTAARRWWALRRDAEHIDRMKLPGGMAASLREQALASLATAHWKLRQQGAALRATERFLREFPTSPHYATMELQANRLIAELRERQTGPTTAASVLAELDRARAEGTRGGTPVTWKVRHWERKRCELMTEHFLLEEALPVCRAFIESWRRQEDLDSRRDVLIAWRMDITALAELGRFAEARARLQELEAFVASHPDLADRRHLVEGLHQELPSDDEPT